MLSRVRGAVILALSTLAVSSLPATSASASVLSLLPGSCGSATESQPFAAWGDRSSYTLMPGGSFEAGTLPWGVTDGATTVAGNESYYVSGAGSRSLSLPSGSSATSPATCTSIYHPTVRFFARNAGAASSRLLVQALYPGLLGGVQVSNLGQIAGTSQWQPSPAMSLLVSNLLSTLSLNETVIAFRFVPQGAGGAWSVDDVYLDPYHRG